LPKDPATKSLSPSINPSQISRLVFVGDSLTAGFGLAENLAFPALVERSLTERGVAVKVINAGVSGDTSAGGLSRIDWILRQQPDIVAVCLGANDGLRGLSIEMTENNLRSILERIVAAGAQPILLGMRLPPNLGPEYIRRFESIYPSLATQFEIPLVPFLLEGVGGETNLNLPDGIHPNPLGHQRIAENVLSTVEGVLEKLHSE
jgi:acyl-CoA thioesterase-1